MGWETLLSSFAAVGLSGALAVPALRRKAFGDVRQDWLNDELEIDRVDSDSATIHNKCGALTRVWKIQGTSYDSKLDEEQKALHLARSAALSGLCKKADLALRLIVVKRRRPLSVAGAWPVETLAEIGRAEEKQYRSSHRIDWYLMATGRSMQALIDADLLLKSRLGVFKPELLKSSPPGEGACELTGFLNGLVCGEFSDVLPARSHSISGSLPAADLQFDKSGTVRTEGSEKAVQKIIAIREWPEAVSGQLIAALLAIEGDLEIDHLIEPWARDRALLMWKRQQRQEKSNILFPNRALSDETDYVLEKLSDGTVCLLVSQFQIVARAPNETELDRLVDKVREVLGDRRVVASVETVGAPICWFNRLPKPVVAGVAGPGAKFLRPLTITENVVAALWPFIHSPSGMHESPFGKGPVRLFRTRVGQAYNFQFHVSNKDKPLGHFLVFAPTGGGKSTLMLHLLSGLAKFPGVRSYLFDSKEGARFMVEAMGGVYQPYEKLALNPLDVGADTVANRNRVSAMLRLLAGEAAYEDGASDILRHAVDLAFLDEPPHRSLNGIFEHAFPRNTNLRRSLGLWVRDAKGNIGSHSHVFNAPDDSLSGVLDHFMVAINMNEALEDPLLGPPVVSHIASAIGRTAGGGKGFAIFIDEAAKLLENPGFEDFAAEMYREYRKLGGVVGLAFQDPAALAACRHSKAIIENTATMIFLPNSNARPESFAPFGLNEEQLAFATGRTIQSGHREALVVKRDASSGYEETAIIDIDLGYLGDALRFYASGPDRNKQIEKLQEEWGQEWRRHL
tara:strand:+ start:1373 stop:3757 length:2385 start_codon:yes stop_codon:yes gene_type:complete